MKTPTASLLALSLLALAAQPTLARSPAEAQADEAQAQLSARYTALWSQMPAGERPAFSRAERHWLHVDRWAERQRCVDAVAGSAVPDDAAARCLAEVTLRRLGGLPPPAVAAR